MSVACTRQVRSEAISGHRTRAEAGSSNQSIQAPGLAGWAIGEVPALLAWYPSFRNLSVSRGRSQHVENEEGTDIDEVWPQCEAARCHRPVASQFDPHDSRTELE